ncbi:hypothetical protein [Lacinutrix salivirga]
MKKSILLTLLLVTLFACKKENSTFSKIEETVNNAKNASKVISNVQDAQKEVQKLVDKEPITKEVLKAWMPDQLKDLKRTSYTLGNNGMVNFSTINLQYKSAENIQKQFKVEIIDGAGGGAAAVYMYKMIENMSLDKETENSYEKIYKRGDITIKERYTTYPKSGTRLKMEFLYNNRFAVNINANNIDADEMWTYVEAMKFNNLKQ